MDSRLIFLHTIAFAMEGRRVVLIASYWIGAGMLRRLDRQIRLTILQGRSGCEATADQIWGARFREKLLSLQCSGSVPQTDTGGKVEKTKANE